jgi:hypothetical protein
MSSLGIITLGFIDIQFVSYEMQLEGTITSISLEGIIKCS